MNDEWMNLEEILSNNAEVKRRGRVRAVPKMANRIHMQHLLQLFLADLRFSTFRIYLKP